jgi:hypothetical protein
MVFNKELLFIHVLKTAGMSLTHFFLSRLSAPIHYITQKGHFGDYATWSGVITVIGNRHGDLHYARNFLKSFNLLIEDFKTIISVIRNPYASEISRFFYFARDLNWIDPRAPEVILAKQGDFESFAKNAPYKYGESDNPDISRYYTVDGKMPNNMGLLRFENLQKDLAKILSERKIRFSKTRSLKYSTQKLKVKRPQGTIKDVLSILKIYKPYRIPHVNRTKKPYTLEELITPEAEIAIYKKYKWVFDNGYYDRITF